MIEKLTVSAGNSAPTELVQSTEKPKRDIVHFAEPFSPNKTALNFKETISSPVSKNDSSPL